MPWFRQVEYTEINQVNRTVAPNPRGFQIHEYSEDQKKVVPNREIKRLSYAEISGQQNEMLRDELPGLGPRKLQFSGTL